MAEVPKKPTRWQVAPGRTTFRCWAGVRERARGPELVGSVQSGHLSQAPSSSRPAETPLAAARQGQSHVSRDGDPLRPCCQTAPSLLET